LHELFPKDQDVDVVPPEEWQKTNGEAAAIFVRFLGRQVLARATVHPA
jgi:hypothetical protein